jgi:sugar phosphate permease
MNTDTFHRRSPQRWLVFWILALGYVTVYFHRLSPAVVAEEMRRDLAAGGSLLGLLGSAYFYPYALMQIPAGLLADSWGPRRTIAAFLCAAFAGSIVLSASPDAYVAVAGRALVGTGVAMLFVPALKVLAEWFDEHEFAHMTGVLMAMGGIGSYGAAAPLAYVSGVIGWRWSFALVGGFTLALAALVWAFVRDRPPEPAQPSKRPSRDEGEWNRDGAAGDGRTAGGRAGAGGTGAERAAGRGARAGPAPLRQGHSRQETLLQGVKTVVSHPRFWPLASWFFFTCAVFFSFVGLWGGPYLMQVYGLGKAEAGHILSMAAVGMIAGSPLLSFASNNLFKARKPVLVMSGCLLSAAAGTLFFFPRGLPPLLLSLVCFMIGVSGGASVTVGFAANKELFPLPIAGTASGLVNFFPFFGGAVFQVVLGAVLDRAGLTEAGGFTPAGFTRALLVLFACGLAALASSLFVRETMKAAGRRGPREAERRLFHFSFRPATSRLCFPEAKDAWPPCPFRATRTAGEAAPSWRRRTAPGCAAYSTTPRGRGR